MRKSVLVTGCPRSGTKYIALLLNKLGLDVRHEAIGSDGTSNWCLAVAAEQIPWGEGQSLKKFDVAIHQVRNPIDCIPSFSTLTEPSWAFIKQYLPICDDEPLLTRCARLWCLWNLRAEQIATWRYRIETLPVCFDEFCDRIGVPADRAALDQLSTNINTRRFRGMPRGIKWAYTKFNVDPPTWVRNNLTDSHAYDDAVRFDWKELRSYDAELHDQVRALAERYGYNAADLDRATGS